MANHNLSGKKIAKERRLRILHAPAPVAKSAWKLSRAERKLGYQSDCMVLEPGPIGSPYDYSMKFDQDTNRWSRFLRLGFFFIKSLVKYDVFHFHTQYTLLPHHIDLPVLRATGKKVFFHFHGSEIRLPGRIPAHCKNADGYFVSLPDLLEIIPEAVLLPQQIDLSTLPTPTAFIPQQEKLVVLHAILSDVPYCRQIKGTDWILSVFDSISTFRSDIEFRFVSNLAHVQLISEIAKADIVVDQVVQGWYGNLSVEGMALEKTVLNWIRPDLTQFMQPTCPIINTCKETLQKDLIGLIDDPSRRESLGKEGRRYVERVHAAERVAEIAVQCYLKAFEHANDKG